MSHAGDDNSSYSICKMFMVRGKITQHCNVLITSSCILGRMRCGWIIFLTVKICVSTLILSPSIFISPFKQPDLCFAVSKEECTGLNIEPG